MRAESTNRGIVDFIIKHTITSDNAGSTKYLWRGHTSYDSYIKA